MKRYGVVYRSLIVILCIFAFAILTSACNTSDQDEQVSVGASEENESELPQWLNLEHRSKNPEVTLPVKEVIVETVVQEVVVEIVVKEVVVEIAKDTSTVSDTKTIINNNTAIPKWQQAGTKEYIAKMKLDERVWYWNNHQCRVARVYKDYKDEKIDEETYKDRLKDLRIQHCKNGKDILRIAGNLGISIYAEYGITINVPSRCCLDDRNWWELDFKK